MAVSADKKTVWRIRRSEWTDRTQTFVSRLRTAEAAIEQWVTRPLESGFHLVCTPGTTYVSYFNCYEHDGDLRQQSAEQYTHMRISRPDFA